MCTQLTVDGEFFAGQDGLSLNSVSEVQLLHL